MDRDDSNKHVTENVTETYEHYAKRKGKKSTINPNHK